MNQPAARLPIRANSGRRQFGSGNTAREMDVMEPEAELASAARHRAAARPIVAQQRARIAKLKAVGPCPRDVELTLEVFVSTLALLEEHERALRQAARNLVPARRLS